MDSAPQPPAVVAENSNDGAATIPSLEATGSTPASSTPAGPTEVPQPTSVAPVEAESAPQPTSKSATDATSATSESAVSTEATADPVAAVFEHVAAPSTQPALDAPVIEAGPGVDSTVTAQSANSGPETTSANVSGSNSIVQGPSTADQVSTEAPNDSVPAASTNKETNSASATDPSIAIVSIGAPQKTAADPNAKSVTDPSSAGAQLAPSSVEDASSATAPSGASNNEQLPPVPPASTSAIQQPDATATVDPLSDIVPAGSDAPPQVSAAVTEPTSTTAEVPTVPPAVESANAAAESTQAPQSQVTALTQSNEAAPTATTDTAVTTEKKESGKEPAAPVPDQQTASKAADAAPQASSSSSTVAAPPAVQAVAASETTTASTPATPEKKAPADGTSAAQSSSSLPSTPAREGRVALILRINKELIRLCVEMQAKELTMDPVYSEAAFRLQANLAYLASIADQAGKSVDPSARSPPKGALPRLEPFPRSEHAPSSPLPALFDRLIALFGAADGSRSPSVDGRKRSRDSTADLGGDDARKRTASKGIDRSPSDASNHPQADANATANTVQSTDASASMPSTNEPASALTLAGRQSQQQQQPALAPQGAQQQSSQQQSSQQPGKSFDLSLAPPVPIAPPAAAQNIPNNPQAQALMQNFGPNALVNLHALQSHLRGQGTHPWVAFMEAHVTGFKGLPLQMQLQQMTSLQNAALQRQKAMQGLAGASSVGSPATMQQSQQMANGGVGAVSSPATTRPASRHSDSPGQAQASPSASAFGGNVPGRTGTPLSGQFPARPGSSGSVSSMTSAGGGGRNRTGSSNLGFDPSQLQSAPSPATMASMAEFTGQQQQPNFGFQTPGLQSGSPAAAGSPSQQQQPQQQGGQPGMGMAMGGMPNFQNLPPHLQQQIRQQYIAHMQAQAQAQGANPQQQFFQSPQ
ncbi:uncharacterized protein SPSC_04448 [Sporisorium scitamineum]|uniref:Uncharacterized protein n=1 Tax=Sporisorium scitamineum TaxID=49012 RepID=A0A0F7S714_9BASI|nr:uncharacterized protein SPSC_04448 [Sporisorium scitamineum]CDW95713.1 hypothetical protein [Sporisorium scitamineum]